MSKTLKPTPVSHAVISDLYWIPQNEIDLHAVRDRFTVVKRIPVYGTKRVEKQFIPTWREDPRMRPGLIGVPIAAGEELFPVADDNALIEELSDGAPFTSWTRRPDPNHERAAPGQAEFMELSYNAVTGAYSALIKAETGTGKTVVFMDTAARLSVRTLVLVPSTNLLRQWVDQFQNVLGVPRSCIGVVQGDKCQWDRDVVVGMLKSNAMRTYPPGFYTGFGLVGYDELHNLGAVLAAKTQGLFNARFKVGMTATDDRKDGADQVYYDYFGKPAFERSMPGVQTLVQSVHLSTPRVNGRGMTDVSLALSRNPDRNETLARIMARWFREGHHVMGVSAFVDHCELMKRYLVALGVPDSQVGLFVGSQTGPDGSRSPTTEAYKDWCKEHPRILIATYEMLTEGVDIPRLGRGIDLTPRSEMEQLLGRIRRRIPGKDLALWVTPRDRQTPRLEGAYNGRIRSIRHLQNVTVERVALDDLL